MGIVGGPIVHLSLCKAGDLPIRTAIFAAPDTCAVPFAAASRPKGAGLRISNDMIDWPSVTVRTLNGPAATVIAATNQKRPLVVPTRRVKFVRVEVIKASLLIRTTPVHYIIGCARCTLDEIVCVARVYRN